MYESDTAHLHPSLKHCPACGKPLKEKYRTKGRTIKSLTGRIDIVCHVYGCNNPECANYKVSIHPEEESLLAIKGYNFGLDVIMKVGHLRYQEHKTWDEIREILVKDYGLKICPREVGYLEQTYLALINVVAKKDIDLLEKLEKLSGLIIAIDGIKPDNSNEVLYLIREIQTGHILAAKILEQSDHLTIQKLLQEVIDLGFPILGVISDKQESILLAVKEKLSGVPHQLCHYHFLKNLAIPIVEEDSDLKKKISKGLAKKVREVENKLEEASNEVPQQEIEVVKDYCLAIKTILKIKSVYPLKPAGLMIYEALMRIKQSMQNCHNFTPNPFLAKLIVFLNILSMFASQANHLKIAFQWLYKIASLLKVAGITEQQAQQQLRDYVVTLDPHNNIDFIIWQTHFEKVTLSWLSGLFRYLVQPLLPLTNNDLESFNNQVKRTHRKITGRKKTQSFISRSGAFVSFLLGLSSQIDLLVKFARVPYDEFRKARENLAKSGLRSKIYVIKRDLDEYLFDLELRWSQPQIPQETGRENAQNPAIPAAAS